MQKWQRQGEPEVVYSGWRTITKKQFLSASGAIKSAEIYDVAGTRAVAVIALTPDNEVIIARQFRCGPEEIFDDLPGGGVDNGESVQQAAVRELAEETGYEADRMVHLGKVYKHGWMETSWDYFIAYDCRPNDRGQQLDGFEEIEIHTISISQLFENARTTKMADTEAVFLAYETLKELEEHT